MKILVFFSIILNSITLFGITNEFKVMCRKKIHGTFQVEKFDDWTIIANDLISTLDGVSIAAGPPKGLPFAIPNNTDTSHVVSAGKLKLPYLENWIVCNHNQMKFVIQQKIPVGLKECTLSDKNDAIEVACK